MFRYYGSGYARFTSPDRLAGNNGNPQSLNRYAYVLNDPLNGVDPLGLLTTPGTPPNPTPIGGAGGAPGDPWENHVLCALYGVMCEDTGIPLFFQGGGHGGGGGRHSAERDQALRALLTNPKCRDLFGGLQNALNALLGTQYFDYTPGMKNPDPGLIDPNTWSKVTKTLDATPTVPPPGRSFLSPAVTVFIPGRGDTFLAALFDYFPSGFSKDGEASQMTIILHELEHVANQSNKMDENYSQDLKNINTQCQPIDVPVESTTPSNLGGVTP